MRPRALRFLSTADGERALQTLQKLARHDISGWALTGGLAVELHRIRLGCEPAVRPLNDLDFVVGSFDAIPATLEDDVLFRHVHPLAAPGKLLLQLIDPESALRVDVFRSSGGTMDRTLPVAARDVAARLVSLEDLIARTARILLDLESGIPTPAKYVCDYVRLSELVEPSQVDPAWRDQRKPSQPDTFDEAAALLERLIPSRTGLLISPQYSKDVEEVCPRCTATDAFPLADARLVLSLLGYC